MEQLQRYAKLSYRVVFPFELRLFNTVSIIDHRIKLLNCPLLLLNYLCIVLIAYFLILCEVPGIL